MPSNDHISRQFDAELEAIRANVLQMGGLVESQIKSAVESLMSGDVALMTRVIEDDVAVIGGKALAQFWLSAQGDQLPRHRTARHRDHLDG